MLILLVYAITGQHTNMNLVVKGAGVERKGAFDAPAPPILGFGDSSHKKASSEYAGRCRGDSIDSWWGWLAASPPSKILSPREPGNRNNSHLEQVRITSDSPNSTISQGPGFNDRGEPAVGYK